MYKAWSENGRKTIFSRIFCPIMMILVVFFAVNTILTQQGLLSYLKTNVAEVFEERVVNRKLYVENSMNRWASINTSVPQIVEQIESIVAKNGAKLTNIQTDAELNQTLLDNLMDEIIDLLYACRATEIFLILDGQALTLPNYEHIKAGIYLRNSSPDTYIDNNQDLLFERGLPHLSREWQISLDSYWETGFDFSDAQNSNYDFYHKPLQAAGESENKDFENFAYWSFGYPISNSDTGVLSYSVPLIASDGSVLGVMGVGVSEKYFSRCIDFKELGGNRTGGYALAKSTDGKLFTPAIFHGIAYNKVDFLGKMLEVRGQYDVDLSYLFRKGETTSNICVNVQPLKLYSTNTPFEEEQWVLLGMIHRDELLQNYNKSLGTLFLIALIGIILNSLSVYWISKLISDPIQRLIESLRRSDPNQPIHLQRTNLEEVDELALSIENLSTRVAEAFSKISTIVQMSELGIGVFEYKEEENLVFCSRSLYELVGWEPAHDTTAYIDGTEFCKRLQHLQQYRVPGEQDLLEIPLEGGGVRWLKFNQRHQDHSLLGVITDVSATILERKQMEYERDYDLLTDIYNRRAFEEKMSNIFKEGSCIKTGALLVWDIDNLKYINDAYGHTVGDAYISALGKCLKKYQGERVISARRSGDEFVTFVYGASSENEILRTVQTIWQEIQQSELSLPNGNPYRIHVSVGVAWYPKDAQDYSSLFQYADFAMYTAKHSHKGTMESFDRALYSENRVLLQGQEEFNKLLDNRLIRYRLQPIVSVSDGAIYGYELLMCSDLELFRSPAAILKMAHAQSRLYDVEITTWFEAMKTFVQMTEYGIVDKDSKVFINSIASQMMRPEMIRLFKMNFERYLPQLVCELTEEEQQDVQLTKQKIQLMREWGGMIAIDDYGGGYNSEAILLEASPDIVKIDMNIVRGIDRDESRQQLVKNLIHYGKERSILILAEGVETYEELDTLIRLGVDLVQGYYIAMPSFEATPPFERIRQEIVRCYQQREQDTHSELTSNS